MKTLKASILLIVISFFYIGLLLSQPTIKSLNSDISVTPDSLSVSLFSGQTSTEILTLTNTGSTELTLNFSTESGSVESGLNHALYFDGVDDYVEIPNDPSLQVQEEITLEAWINFESGGSYQPRIISKGPDGCGYEIVTTSTDPSRNIQLRVGPGEIESQEVFNENEWYHLALSYDLSSICLYINGILDNSIPASGSLNISSMNLFFGQKSTSAWDKYKGQLDEIRIWNKARSQFEIKTFMHSGLTGSESGLVGYWTFNEASGTTVHDRTSNHNNGSLVGGVEWVKSSAPVMNWLQINPSKLTLAPNSSVNIEIVLNAIYLSGGDYKTTIIVNSGEQSDSIQIPVIMKVADAPSIYTDSDTVEFNEVFVNQSKNWIVKLINRGSESLIIEDVTSNSDAYQIPSFYDTIAPGNAGELEINFTPTLSKEYPAILTIASNDPVNPVTSIMIGGRGIKSPVFTIPGDSLHASLLSGKKSSRVLNIQNHSNNDLYFTAIPGSDSKLNSLYFNGEDNFVRINGDPSLTFTSNYTIEAWIYVDSLQNFSYPAIYNGNRLYMYYNGPTGDVGIDFPGGWLISKAKLSSNTWYHVAVACGDSIIGIYINGRLDSETKISGYSSNEDDHYIGSAFYDDGWWGQWIDNYFKGHIRNVRIWNKQRTEAEIQREMYFIITGDRPGLIASLLSAQTSDIWVTDLSSYGNDGIFSGDLHWGQTGPPVFSWFSFTPGSTLLNSGSTKEYNVNFNAANLDAGEYYSELNLSFTHPAQSVFSIPISLEVTDAPSLFVMDDTIRFGNVFLNDTAIQEIKISNLGSQDLLIFNSQTGSGEFTISPPFAGIDPGENEVFMVRFIPSEEKMFNDLIKLISNDPISDTVYINLTGTGIRPPIISITPDSIVEFLNNGKISTRTLTIVNLGYSDLRFEVIPGTSSNNFVLQFDGVDDYVNVGNFGDYSDQVTVEAWVKTEGSSNWDDIIAGPCGDIIFTIEKDKLNFAGQCGSPIDHNAWSTTMLNDNNWHHIAGTYNGTEVCIYVDGLMEDIQPASGSFEPQEKYVGCTRGTHEHFNGLLDDLRIWNIARTQQEIQDWMHQELTGSEAGLISYWPFNEGSGDKTYDKTDNSEGAFYSNIAWVPSTAPVISWFSVYPDSGICPAGSTVDLNLHFDASTVQNNTYSMTVNIYSNDPLQPVIAVPVHLYITPVGIEKKLYNNEITIYPNPANDRIFLSIPVDFNKEFVVEIYNTAGRKVFGKYGYIEHIDVSNYPAGIYFIHVKMDRIIMKDKIVIQ